MSSRNCALMSVSDTAAWNRRSAAARVALDEFGYPLAIRAPHGRMRSDGVGERLERCFRKMLLLEPLQDRPVLEHVVGRRHEQRIVVRRK